MSPPRPPSPPSGPPNSMNFSRRKLTAPAPPSPLFRKILHWSRNFIGRAPARGKHAAQTKTGERNPFPRNSRPRSRRGRGGRDRLVPRLHRNEGAPAGGAPELDIAGGGGEERVVAAHADIAARMKLGAALAHDDVAGDDGFATELLHAQPLAGGIAAVPGT